MIPKSIWKIIVILIIFSLIGLGCNLRPFTIQNLVIETIQPTTTQKITHTLTPSPSPSPTLLVESPTPTPTPTQIPLQGLLPEMLEWDSINLELDNSQTLVLVVGTEEGYEIETAWNRWRINKLVYNREMPDIEGTLSATITRAMYENWLIQNRKLTLSYKEFIQNTSAYPIKITVKNPLGGYINETFILDQIKRIELRHINPEDRRIYFRSTMVGSAGYEFIENGSTLIIYMSSIPKGTDSLDNITKDAFEKPNFDLVIGGQIGQELFSRLIIIGFIPLGSPAGALIPTNDWVDHLTAVRRHSIDGFDQFWNELKIGISGERYAKFWASRISLFRAIIAIPEEYK